MKGQKGDPIASQEYQFEFPNGQIAVGESFDVCVEGPDEYSDCKSLTNSPAKQPEEVTFSID
jgi:hypothetical protein